MTATCDNHPAASPSCCGSFHSKARVGFVIVLIIAAATRLIGLGSLDPWGDEVYSHTGSSDLITNILRWDIVNNDSPPWAFIEMKLARQLFGDSSALTFRVPSALHGILAVALLYLFLCHTLDHRIAFASTLLLAINPWCLEWSREGRMYLQWLSLSVVLIGALHLTVEHARTRDDSPLNWRWWLLGFVFMGVFVTHFSATMTLVGAGGWLGIVALVDLKANRQRGIRIILGAALAGMVFLASWGVVGIAKILTKLNSHKPASDWVPPAFMDEFQNFLTTVAGMIPLWAAIPLWIIAAVGFAMLIRDGKWRIATLIGFVSLSAWLSYPTIVKTHFFAPRYVFTALITLSVGLGVVAAALCQGKFIRSRVIGCSIVGVALVGMLALWSPFAYEVFFVPKMAVRQALAPIQKHGAKGDVLILVPDWYISFDRFKPYQFSDKVMPIRGPKGTWYDLSPDAFKGEFELIFNPPVVAAPEATARPQTTAAAVPTATWLFLLRSDSGGDRLSRWDRRLEQIEPVLAAYGLTRADLIPHIQSDSYTLTFRLSRDAQNQPKIDHVVSTIGRRFR